MARTELIVSRLEKKRRDAKLLEEKRRSNGDDAGDDDGKALDSEIEELRAILDLRARNRAAISWFTERFGPMMWRVCRDLLGNEHDAEDAWQDACIKLWQNVGKWDPERGPFVAWLAVLARNCALDLYRKRKRRAEYMLYKHDDSDEDLLNRLPDPRLLQDAIAERDELMSHIRSAVDRIPNADHRVAFVLRHFEGMNTAQMVEAMGAKESTVKVWVYRGLQCVAQSLPASLRQDG